MSKVYEKVQNNPSLVRDKSSNAVININETAYQARLNQKEAFKKHVQQADRMLKKLKTY